MSRTYLDFLIDDFGIWQHSDGTRILRQAGYALDDAARGLILCLATKRHQEAEVLFKYIARSATKDGFYGFATAKRSLWGLPASADATGQVTWAMGYALTKDFKPNQARSILECSIKQISTMTFVRGVAYALLGALYSDRQLAGQLTDRLMGYFINTPKGWLWPEPELTYANGIVPYALLRSGAILKNQQAGDLGRRVLEFVHARCARNRTLGPIGNLGWLTRGQPRPPDYSQQPIDAAYMVWAWLAAHRLRPDQPSLEAALDWYDWFEGKNISGQPLYAASPLKCFDGINPEGLNTHSGAEANICLLLTKWMLQHKTTL